MTAAENIAIAPRTGKAFKFLRKRGNATEEFYPGAGSRLRFANRDVDTFQAQGLPAGLLQAGDKVTVQYNGSGSWVTVFSGEVERIVDAHGKGDERVQTVTVAGPWSAMNRLVFRQTWGDAGAEIEFSSSRVILGQDVAGAPQTIKAQLGEILSFAAQKCGFSYDADDIDALAQYLPLDEARDITCADAVRRELRFFPKRIVRFDYSGATPAIEIVDPDTTDASYVTTIPKTARVYEYNAHPVSCVDVAVDATDIIVGGTSATYHQVYPANGDVTALDCLHVTVPLARGSSSTTSESFKSVTEDIPSNIATNAQWWKQKHPRLANVAQSAITITNGTRSPSNYPRIAKSTKGELEAAGLHCEVSRFTCDCKIATTDDEEEDIKLTMDFLTTDATGTEAHPKTYTWQTGSSSTAGETLPEGLAQALYEQRAQSLVNERMAVRLGAAFPQLGDAADGLFLQSFDVDVYDLTAQLSFGQPEHLSAEDMRSLLNGFRQRGYATTAKLRKETADEDADEADAPGGIPPISSSEWSPGTKSKQTFCGFTTSGGNTQPNGNRVIVDTGSSGSQVQVVDSNNKTISLNAHALSANDQMQVQTLTYTDGSGSQRSLKVLATEDATIPPGSGGGGSGGGGEGGGGSSSGVQISLLTGVGTAWDSETRRTNLTVSRRRVHVLSVDDSQPQIESFPVASAEINFVTGVVPSWDASTNTLTLTLHRRKFRVVGTEDLDQPAAQSTETIQIPIPAATPSTTKQLVTGVIPSWDATTGQMKLTINRRNATIQGMDMTGNPITETVNVPLYKTNLVAGTKYDESSHKFQQKRVAGVTSEAVSSGDVDGFTATDVFTATPHSAE